MTEQRRYRIAGIISFATVTIQIIFLALKLFGIIDWSWLIVAAPVIITMIPPAVFCFIGAVGCAWVWMLGGIIYTPVDHVRKR